MTTITTFVGTQNDPIAALHALLELEYDALEAYKLAIEKLEHKEWKDQLNEFKGDHDRHVQELTELLKQHADKVPQGPTAKHYLTKGKVALGSLVGDKAILLAMKSNEQEMVAAYTRLHERQDLEDKAQPIVKAGLADEKRHAAWIESVTS